MNLVMQTSWQALYRLKNHKSDKLRQIYPWGSSRRSSSSLTVDEIK